jgi:hypothetical protein
MGETLHLRAERLRGDEGDSTWSGINRTRPMAERLERAFDAAGFADDLRGTAARR